MMKDLLTSIGKFGFFILGTFVLILGPTSFLELGHSICLIKNIVGIECPGCGMTRAVASIFHGDFLGAFHYNKSVVIVFPLLCYICLKTFINGYRREYKECERNTKLIKRLED